jgi:drug/metabolite transporter (DMT)-like permease
LPAHLRNPTLSSFALTLVLSAAVLHASWNALVKGAADRAVVIAAVASVHATGGLLLILTATPPAPASWWAIATSSLIHYLYYALLFQAYRLGDLSQVYPISRGLAPAMVALGTFLTIGESLTPTGWLGLAAVSIGIVLLALQRGAVHADRKAVAVAVVLGLTIGCYSVTDGIGVRLSGSPAGYMGWLFLLEGPVVLAVLLARHRRKAAMDWRTYGIGLIGGVFAVTAYGVVLYAKTLAPIAAVSAVRESSVVIAALLGIVFFDERPWTGRIACAAVVAAGVITLAMAD